VHSVINTFYVTSKDKLSDVAVCSHCLKKNDPTPAEIEVEQLIAAFMGGSVSLPCPKDPVRRTPFSPPSPAQPSQ